MGDFTRLPIIDADGHVMEPFALWQERLPEQYRDMAWRRVTVDGVETVQFYGRATQFEWSLGSLCTPGCPPRRRPPRHRSRDRV